MQEAMGYLFDPETQSHQLEVKETVVSWAVIARMFGIELKKN